MVKLIGGLEKEIFIVSDCSRDNTKQVILKYIHENNELNICYLKHEVDSGKGSALHTGIKHATGEFIIVQDADLEYDPKKCNLSIEPIIDDFADVVFEAVLIMANLIVSYSFGIPLETKCLHSFLICLQI